MYDERNDTISGASCGAGNPVRDAFAGEASAKLAQERINTVSDQCCAEDVIRPADPSLPTAHGLRQRRKKLLEEFWSRGALLAGRRARTRRFGSRAISSSSVTGSSSRSWRGSAGKSPSLVW